MDIGSHANQFDFLVFYLNFHNKTLSSLRIKQKVIYGEKKWVLQYLDVVDFAATNR